MQCRRGNLNTTRRTLTLATGLALALEVGGSSVDSATTKPQKLSAPNQPAATYTLIIVNFGPEDESIAYQVLFTNGASMASASEGEATGEVVS